MQKTSLRNSTTTMRIAQYHASVSLACFILILTVGIAWTASAQQPELIELRKIWDAAPHNAFTDLIRFEGRWYCTFREGERHVYGEDGKIRIIASDDGERWESVGLLEEEGVDLRDPKLSVTPDERLMVVAGGSVYRDRELLTRQPRVAFSKDGQAWSAPRRVLAEGDWLWRVTWHKGKAYGVSYDIFENAWKLKLFESADGLSYELITLLDVPGRPNETTLRFLPDDRMMALVRREEGDQTAWIGVSEPPYEQWTWNASEYRVGGPNFIVLPDGRMWAAGRDYVGHIKTVLARFGERLYDPVLELPSDGDTSYPGLVWHDGILWMSYYSGHEGKTSIYLAKIRLPE